MSYSWRRVSFSNPRGLRLAGLLHAGGRPAPLVLVAHGFLGTKEGRGKALEMAEALAAMGYATLLFDFAGSGESEGEFADVSLSNHAADLDSALAFARGAGFGPVVLCGRSFGAAAALVCAAADPGVAGVCTWAAPARLEPLFRAAAGAPGADGLVPLGSGVRVRPGFFSDLARHDLLRAAGEIAPRPLLVVHGTADKVVPFSDARELYAAAREPKELRAIPGADHQFGGRHREVWEAFFAWLARHFPTGG
ncbi:MAG: alpha/beta hydrolase [Firmicutes bacterium]|nr:alpha/beta hydrolase [Bacillota bacterium]